MAVALVIFARWSPLRCVLAALLFGAAGAIGPSLQSVGITQGYYFFNAAPYILTLVIMIATVERRRARRATCRANCPWRSKGDRDMSGLGGLNKSPNGVVIGLVQLQLPVVVTPADLARADRTHRRDGRQGAAQHGDDGSRGVPGIFAARPVDGHQSRRSCAGSTGPRSRRSSGACRRQRHLGLLLASWSSTPTAIPTTPA